jgi:hypothetical protein
MKNLMEFMDFILLFLKAAKVALKNKVKHQFDLHFKLDL